MENAVLVLLGMVLGIYVLLRGEDRRAETPGNKGPGREGS